MIAPQHPRSRLPLLLSASFLVSLYSLFATRWSRPYDYNNTSPLPSPSIPGAPSPFSTSSSPTSSPGTGGFHHFSHSADVGSGGLTKQTYSAWVTLPAPDGTTTTASSNPDGRKKWHMTVSFLPLHNASRARGVNIYTNNKLPLYPLLLRRSVDFDSIRFDHPRLIYFMVRFFDFGMCKKGILLLS